MVTAPPPVHGWSPDYPSMQLGGFITALILWFVPSGAKILVVMYGSALAFRVIKQRSLTWKKGKRS